jgi:hypothetical protein
MSCSLNHAARLTYLRHHIECKVSSPCNEYAIIIMAPHILTIISAKLSFLPVTRQGILQTRLGPGDLDYNVSRP